MTTIDNNSSDALSLPLSCINRLMVKSVGGKAANLGEMLQNHFIVPDGFVITGEAYKLFLKEGLSLRERKDLKSLIDNLGTSFKANDLDNVRYLGARIREILYEVPIPKNVCSCIEKSWTIMRTNHNKNIHFSVAVRSSATLEDLPNASFAGQYDTFLNISNYESLLKHIKYCWISVFTDRAISYRLNKNFDIMKCSLCVIVQTQIIPDVSGVMFTADAITGLRHLTVIEAVFGLGEALVSGSINPDVYKYNRKCKRLEKKISMQDMEMVPIIDQKSDVGGIKTVKIEESRKKLQKLTDKQILDLVRIGAEIERHYHDIPQDIEWCVEKGTGKLFVVQTRPITTLFPLPDVVTKGMNIQAFVSFGHLQVMMDPIRPCGRSVFKHFFPFGRHLEDNTSSFVSSAGCYVFLNPTPILQIKILGNVVLLLFGKVMKNVAVCLEYVMQRKDFVSVGSTFVTARLVFTFFLFLIPKLFLILWILVFKSDVEILATSKLNYIHAYVSRVRTRVRSKYDPQERIKAALDELHNLHNVVFQIMPLAFAGFLSMGLLRSLVQKYVDKKCLDSLERGLSGNVTTDMNLEIGDLADVARQEVKVMEWLKNGWDLSKNGLYNLRKEDSIKFRLAFNKFLDLYGSRANSEIDISRQRWREDPSPIFQVIRGNLNNDESGHHRKHHENLKIHALESSIRIIQSAPWYKRFIIRRLSRTARALMALREHGKFLLIQIMDELRQAILEVGLIHVKNRTLNSIDDIWFLTVEEVLDSLNWNGEMLKDTVSRQKSIYEVHSKLIPPTVLTSEGECINIHPNTTEIPAGALRGLGVSSGVTEGVAKVVIDPTLAVLNSGEILVARSTDPGWTPLFINASAVVMEVGSYLTHGSVVSREYNLPAVSCVTNATAIIKTGMKLRVDGTRGFVQILSTEDNLMQ